MASKFKNIKFLPITFFGCGNVKIAPGTFTSFITTILWLVISLIFQQFVEISIISELFFWLAISILLFIYGLLFIDKYEEFRKTHDHPSIVIDEVIGQLITLSPCYFASLI